MAETKDIYISGLHFFLSVDVKTFQMFLFVTEVHQNLLTLIGQFFGAGHKMDCYDIHFEGAVIFLSLQHFIFLPWIKCLACKHKV